MGKNGYNVRHYFLREIYLYGGNEPFLIIRIVVQSAVETKTIHDASDANAYLHTAAAYVAANPQDAFSLSGPTLLSRTVSSNILLTQQAFPASCQTNHLSH